ncbi:MAG TPA: YqgE/AlgH family protein [Candidatus Binatia bacterium]
MTRFCWLALAVALAAGRPAAAVEEPLIGQFLVAAPEMADPRFVESVVYITAHAPSGAVGLVINHPVAEGPLADLLKAVGESGEEAKGNVAIHFGGPVDPDRLLVLHSNDYAGKATTFVGNGLGVTSDVDILKALARGKGPRQKLLLFGYAGWGPGQLEAELKSNAWFVVPADSALIFGPEPEKKWERALAKRKFKT